MVNKIDKEFKKFMTSVKGLIKEGVLTESDKSYKFSDKFVECVARVRDDVANKKFPESIIPSGDRNAMLAFLFFHAYVYFIPKGIVFSDKGVVNKIDTMITIMSFKK